MQNPLSKKKHDFHLNQNLSNNIYIHIYYICICTNSRKIAWTCLGMRGSKNIINDYYFCL